MRRSAVLAVVLLVLTGCGSGGSADAKQPVSSAAASPSATASIAPLTAADVLARLTSANVGLTNGAVQTADTDPNHMIGTSTGYTSRASFDLPGGDPEGDKYDVERGGAIEVFADEETATARAKYIDGIAKAMPAVAERHYQRGPILVRVAKDAPAGVADKVKAAVEAL